MAAGWSVEVSQGLGAQRDLSASIDNNPTGGFVAVHAGRRRRWRSAEFAGDRLLVQTNQDAPNYALYEVDPEQPERASWRLVLPSAADRVLDSVVPPRAGWSRTRCTTPRRRCALYGLDGALQTEVQLPALGTRHRSWRRVGRATGSRWASRRSPSRRRPTVVDPDHRPMAEVFAQGDLPPGFDAVALRSPPGVVHLEGRHARVDVPGPPSRRAGASTARADAAHRLRRLQRQSHADVRVRAAAVARRGRRVRARRTCGAAASTARPGTGRACSATSRMSSTTSSRRANG